MSSSSVLAAGEKTVTRGQSAKLEWSTSGATFCRADTAYPSTADGWRAFWKDQDITNTSGDENTNSKTLSVYANAGSYLFSCKATLADGSEITDSATLIVKDCPDGTTWSGTACVDNPSDPTADLYFNPVSIPVGGSTQFSLTSLHAQSCTIREFLYDPITTGSTETVRSPVYNAGEPNVPTTPWNATGYAPGTYIYKTICYSGLGGTGTPSAEDNDILVINAQSPCLQTVISNCSLPEAPRGETGGVCVDGYSGLCSYTCSATTGTWGAPSSNTCVVDQNLQILTDPSAVDTATSGQPKAGSASTITATVKNTGAAAVSGSYNNIFLIDNDPTHTAAPSIYLASQLSNTATNGTGNITLSYTFPAVDTFYVRACADQNLSRLGVVSETDENDNCGGWIPVNVAPSAAPPTVSCSVDPTSGNTSTPFVYNANASGGSGPPYTYTWGGSVSGTGSPKTVYYDAGGPYSATVLATDSLGISSNLAVCAQVGPVTAAPLPDYQVPNQVTVVGTPMVGSSFHFSAVVRNSSLTTAATSSSRIRFQADLGAAGSAYTGSTINLDTPSGAVAPIAANNNSPSINSPSWSPTVPGTYHVRACADQPPTPNGAIGEFNEDNNCGPDLQFIIAAPLAVSCSVNPTSGDTSTTFRWTAVPSGGSGIYTTFTWGGDVSGTGNPKDITFAQGGPYSANVRVTDSLGNVSPNTVCSNQVTSVTGVPKPDLVISVDAASNISSPTTSQTPTLSATVKNQGTAAVSGTYNNVIRVDNDADHSTVYATLATNQLANTGINGTGSISIPYNFPTPGTWYMTACADNNASMVQSVDEIDNGNNCGNWIPITVTAALADYVVPAVPTISGSRAVGNSITFAATAKNQGAIAPGVASKLRFQVEAGTAGSAFNSPTNLDTATAVVPSLSPNNTSASFSSPAWIPSAGGTYHVRACADQPPTPNGAISETLENNNCGSDTQFTILEASCSASPGAGTTATTFQWSATVTGGTAPFSYSWSGSESLSGSTQSVTKQYSSTGSKNASVRVTDAVGGDTGLVSCTAPVTVSTTVCAATTINNCILPQTPGGSSAGSCAPSYVGSCSYTCDGSTGNWTPVSNTCAPAPDLVIFADPSSSIASPTTAQTPVLSATVKNQGLAAVSGTYNNVIRIDNDTTHSTVYAYLATNQLTNTGINGQGTIQTSYTFPTPGTWYMSACADADATMTGSINEDGNEGNNCGNWVSITVVASGNPSVSCTVNPTSGDTSTTFRWTAAPSGGSGSYTSYTWSGSVSGSGASNYKDTTYAAGGPYTASVRVTDSLGNLSPVTSCSNSVTNVTTGGCFNGAINYPTCTICADGYHMQGGNCTANTATLTVSPSTINSGQSATLTWSSSAGTGSCYPAGGEGVGFTTSGATSNGTGVSTGALSATTNYQLRCYSGPGATGVSWLSNIATVTVNSSTVTVTAVPSRVPKNGVTTVSWNATNVLSCTITKNGVLWQTPTVNGTTHVTTAPLSAQDTITAQTIYRISCNPVGGGAALTNETTVNIVTEIVPF